MFIFDPTVKNETISLKDILRITRTIYFREGAQIRTGEVVGGQESDWIVDDTMAEPKGNSGLAPFAQAGPDLFAQGKNPVSGISMPASRAISK